MIEELTQLAQYGLAGVCISLVVLIGYLFNKVFKLFSNHVDHTTKAWNKNTKVLTKLSERINEDTTAQIETTKVLRGLQKVIKDK